MRWERAGRVGLYWDNVRRGSLPAEKVSSLELSDIVSPKAWIDWN